MRRIHFTNPSVQEKVDMLSLRAQGRAKEARLSADAEDVYSQIQGHFVLDRGKFTFDNLVYTLPGATFGSKAFIHSMESNSISMERCRPTRNSHRWSRRAGSHGC
jgi:hypothetical protein